jgi:hypothetical protein
VLSAGVTLPGVGRPFRALTLHLDNADAIARAAQAREVAGFGIVEGDSVEMASGAPAGFPVIAGGDFNARSGTDALLAMTQLGFVEASGSEGTTRIDHVFVHRTAPFDPIEREVIFTGADAVSDHPGILVRFAQKQVSVTVRPTRIIAKGSFGAPLSVRGARAPLSWDKGWPAFPFAGGAPDEVKIVLPELGPGAFEMKFLKNDADWQLGANATAQGETDNVITPAFP